MPTCCQVCGAINPTVIFTDVVDGKKRTLQLCGACAAEKGFVIDPDLIEAAAAEIKKLLPIVAEATEEAAVDATEFEGSRCEVCGATWADFKKTSRLGCAHDYDLFSARLEPIFQKIHGATQHRGRVSERAGVRLARLKKLEVLKSELDEAILAEEFERAATLRDRLRCMEREGDSDHAAI